MNNIIYLVLTPKTGCRKGSYEIHTTSPDSTKKQGQRVFKGVGDVDEDGHIHILPYQWTEV